MRGGDSRSPGEGPIRVAILGSTGSIGQSALRLLARHPDRFRATVLVAHRSVAALREQAEAFDPACVVVTDEGTFQREVSRNDGRWKGGRAALLDAVSRPDVDVVINALVGFAGLEPSLRALEAGKRLALANKESLVAGGPLVLGALQRGGGVLVPIDSEHSAILQCIQGAPPEAVSRVTLTASGGPFRGWDAAQLASATPADALRHPTWSMGAKISIDSATLANKALEVIEAHVLYGLPYDRIGAVVHPSSIIHSFVEFVDGSVVAQLGFPTMELPILYALGYPDRIPDATLRSWDPTRSPPLTFEAIDDESFPLFRIGVEAGMRGAAGPVVFNGANEMVVSAFLEGALSFPAMAEVVEETLGRVGEGGGSGLDEVMELDREARAVASALVQNEQTLKSGWTG